MDLNELIIGDIFITDNKIVIGTTFKDIEAKEKGAKMDNSFFIDGWKDKQLKISGEDYTIETNILDINVTSSLADFKNIFFLTDLKSKKGIKNNDSVTVLL